MNGRVGMSESAAVLAGKSLWLLLLAVGLGVAMLAALWVNVPGYMDAEYYMATALRLVEGHGLSEPFIWNYLDDPRGLPHPSHLYWMPLISFIAAGSMALVGHTFRAAQAPFVMMTAMLPLVSGWLCLRLGGGKREALLAGLFAAASGFFLPFFVTTDAFAAYALIGTAIFVLAASGERLGGGWLWLVLGLLTGAAHLARADGLLFLLPVGVAVLRAGRRRGVALVAVVAGYLLVMGPWMARNLAVSGRLLSTAGTKTLWLATYDDLFRYPASSLNPSALAAQGVGALVSSRMESLLTNLSSLWLVNGLVFIAPLAAWAGWSLRRRPVVMLASVYWGSLLVVMSFVFPFSGARGGYFHSSAAVMPLVWALAPLGLVDLVGRAGRRRGWDVSRAQTAFAAGAVLVAGVATAFLFVQRLVLPAGEGAGWGAAQRDYATVAARFGAQTPGVVAVNDPPGFWLASRRPAVVIPNGDERMLQRVVEDFDVRWIVLEADHPDGLDGVYQRPGSLEWARLSASVESSVGRPIWILEPKDGGG